MGFAHDWSRPQYEVPTPSRGIRMRRDSLMSIHGAASVRIAEIHPRDWASAGRFLSAHIRGVTEAKVGASSLSNTYRVLGESVPHSIWLGAYEEDLLVGAVHGAVPNEAEQVAQSIVNRVPNPGSAVWLKSYAQGCTVINEIAVAPTHLRLGIGTSLIEGLHQYVMADELRQGHYVTAYATTQGAEDLFKSAGYLVGSQHESLPIGVQYGLQTRWDVRAFGPGFGAWVHRQILK